MSDYALSRHCLHAAVAANRPTQPPRYRRTSERHISDAINDGWSSPSTAIASFERDFRSATFFPLTPTLHFGASVKKEIDSLGPCILSVFFSFFSLVPIKLPIGPYWSPTGLWSVGLALILLIDRQ